MRRAPVRRVGADLRPGGREPREGGLDARSGSGVDRAGADFDAAREHCEQLSHEHGYRYVHSGNEPHLIAGVATGTLEIMEKQPQIDVIVVPIGGGSGAGACIVAKGHGRASR